LGDAPARPKSPGVLNAVKRLRNEAAGTAALTFFNNSIFGVSYQRITAFLAAIFTFNFKLIISGNAT
jgi:hypothetical protein